MDAGPFVGALTGAVVGGSLAMIVNIVKARLDLFSARCEEVSKQALLAADLASEYWLMNFAGDPASPGSEPSVTRQKAQLLEVRIVGLQAQIFHADEELRPELPHAARRKIAGILPELIDAFTGEDFMSRDGTSRPDRAMLAQTVAAELITEIRGAHRKRYMLSHMAKRMFHQH